jgi:transposase-like protein
MSTELNCPHCSAAIAATEQNGPRSVECPHCGSTFDTVAAADRPAYVASRQCFSGVLAGVLILMLGAGLLTGFVAMLVTLWRRLIAPG